MKNLLKIFVVNSLSVCLTGCFGLFNSKDKNNSSNNSGQDDSSNIASLEIYRLESYGMVDFEWVFTNGGISEYALRGVDKDGNTFDNIRSGVDWRVEDSSIAGVDSSGTVNGKKDGVTKLIAKYQKKTAEFELKVRTIAKTFELKEQENEYRTGVLYSMPLNLSPENATVDYTFSNEDTIALQTNYPNKFTVKNPGSVHVTAHAYTTWRGEQDTLEFDIATVNRDAPTFYLKGTPSTSSTFTCAKNKYSSIPFSAMNLVAKSSSNAELTIYSSTETPYNLSVVGIYNVTLYATDTVKNLTSYYYLTLNVEEYEEQAVLSPIDAIDYDNYSMTLLKKDYSLAVYGFTVSARVYLNSKYVCSDGVIHFWFDIYGKVWSQSRYVDETFKKDLQMSKDGPTACTLTETWTSPSDLDPDNLTITPNIFLSRNCYKHIYY